MAKGATENDQFIFLISCIRHSNNGKVNFENVAEECNIISKGAAAKRYERMMKAHGIAPQASGGRDTNVTPMRPKSKKASDDAHAADEDGASPTKKRKRAPSKKAAPATAKEDLEDDEECEMAVKEELSEGGDNDEEKEE